MDQQKDTGSPASATGENVCTPADAPKARSGRRTRSSGGHAIERIAAAARALADGDGSKPDSTKVESTISTSLVAVPSLRMSEPRASAPIAPPLSAKPSRLPLYVAALCLAVGTGGVVGSMLTPAPETALADAEADRIERALPWKREVAEVQARDGGRFKDDLRALRGEIAALRTNNEQLRQAERDRQAQEARAIKAGLESHKAEIASLRADISARFDRADVAQKSDKTAERIDRLERRLADPTATGTTVSKSAAEPPKPEKIEKPIQGIVLREAARGIALVETRKGLLEVMPGDTIPGAGRVEAIEKRGGKWRVVTSTGVIDDAVD